MLPTVSQVLSVTGRPCHPPLFHYGNFQHTGMIRKCHAKIWVSLDILCGEAAVSQPHDDVIKWKHFPRYWPFVRGIHRLSVNSPHKGQWHGALMFYLICAWPNNWANNGDACDLKRRCGHYDVTVMQKVHLCEGVCLRWRHDMDTVFTWLAWCSSPKGPLKQIINWYFVVSLDEHLNKELNVRKNNIH